jgi:hypothetical protein
MTRMHILTFFLTWPYTFQVIYILLIIFNCVPVYLCTSLCMYKSTHVYIYDCFVFLFVTSIYLVRSQIITGIYSFEFCIVIVPQLPYISVIFLLWTTMWNKCFHFFVLSWFFNVYMHFSVITCIYISVQNKSNQIKKFSVGKKTSFQCLVCCSVSEYRKQPNLAYASRVLGASSSMNMIPMLGYVTIAYYY